MKASPVLAQVAAVWGEVPSLEAFLTIRARYMVRLIGDFADLLGKDTGERALEYSTVLHATSMAFSGSGDAFLKLAAKDASLDGTSFVKFWSHLCSSATTANQLDISRPQSDWDKMTFNTNLKFSSQPVASLRAFAVANREAMTEDMKAFPVHM